MPNDGAATLITVTGALNVMVKEKQELSKLPTVTRTISGVEKKLGKDGRVLVRYSGTEPKVRVLVEGVDAKKIKSYAEEIGESLRKALGGDAVGGKRALGA